MVNSALRSFDSLGGGSSMGANPSMYQIGYQGSPFAGPGEIVKRTLDRYLENKKMTQEYGLKKQLLDVGANKSLETEKWKLEQARPNIQALSGWNKDPSLPENQVKIDRTTMVYAPVYDKYGNVIGKKLVNPRAPTMYDFFGGAGVEEQQDPAEQTQFNNDFNALIQGLGA
jgi:hypothetical protein